MLDLPYWATATSRAPSLAKRSSSVYDPAELNWAWLAATSG